MDNNRLAAYLTFSTPVPNPWQEDFLTQQLKNIGATKPIATDSDVQSILDCYKQSPQMRSYHNEGHGAFVGQPDAPDTLLSSLSENFSRPRAMATLSLAGLFHDVAYKHVDELDKEGNRAWPTVLKERIGKFVEYERNEVNGKAVYHTRLTEAGKNNPVTQLVAHIFAMGDEGIIHNQGGNEFDSALAAAKFLAEKGASPKSIVAVVAAIAATVPFKPALTLDDQRNVVGDGHMGDLAKRVKSSQLGEYQPDWQDTNDIMLCSVHLANRDISPFILPDNFSNVIAGGRGVKKEEIHELRKVPETIQELARAASLERSAPFLYQSLGSDGSIVPAENVPHVYMLRNNDGQVINTQEQTFPPLDVYHEAVKNTKRNASLSSDFFKSHEAGIALVAAISTAIGESEAPVPGIVNAEEWHPKAMPKGATFERLGADEKLVYQELMEGAAQSNVDSATSKRSPIGGMLFGCLGRGGMEALSMRLQAIRADAKERGIENPFADPDIATNFVQDVKTLIGPDNFRTITTELHRVAKSFQDDPKRGNPERMAKLEALGEGLQCYQGQQQGICR